MRFSQSKLFDVLWKCQQHQTFHFCSLKNCLKHRSNIKAFFAIAFKFKSQSNPRKFFKLSSWRINRSDSLVVNLLALSNQKRIRTCQGLRLSSVAFDWWFDLGRFHSNLVNTSFQNWSAEVMSTWCQAILIKRLCVFWSECWSVLEMIKMSKSTLHLFEILVLFAGSSSVRLNISIETRWLSHWRIGPPQSCLGFFKSRERLQRSWSF